MHSVFTLYIYHISALLVAIQDAVAARPVAFCHNERRCFHDTLNYDVCYFADWGSRQLHRCRQLKFSQVHKYIKKMLRWLITARGTFYWGCLPLRLRNIHSDMLSDAARDTFCFVKESAMWYLSITFVSGLGTIKYTPFHIYALFLAIRRHRQTRRFSGMVIFYVFLSTWASLFSWYA